MTSLQIIINGEIVCDAEIPTTISVSTIIETLQRPIDRLVAVRISENRIIMTNVQDEAFQLFAKKICAKYEISTQKFLSPHRTAKIAKLKACAQYVWREKTREKFREIANRWSMERSSVSGAVTLFGSAAMGPNLEMFNFMTEALEMSFFEASPMNKISRLT